MRTQNPSVVGASKNHGCSHRSMKRFENGLKGSMIESMLEFSKGNVVVVLAVT